MEMQQYFLVRHILHVENCETSDPLVNGSGSKGVGAKLQYYENSLNFRNSSLSPHTLEEESLNFHDVH